MNNSMPAVLNAALRNDFGSFAHKSFQTVTPGARFKPNYHFDAITWRLEQCRLGNIKRLIITVPPRSGKSICASVAFVAYVLGLDPKRQIITVSYSSDLAIELMRQFRMVMNSPWYRSLFPQIEASKDTELRVRDDARRVPVRHFGRRHAYRARRGLHHHR